MIYSKFEENLLRDILEFAQKQILTPREYGLLKKDRSHILLNAIQKIEINPVLNLTNRKQYDRWFEATVYELHDHIFPLYRENLIVSQNNPFTYTARLLSKYIKFLTFFSPILYLDTVTYLLNQHPIISAKFIEAFPRLEINRVTQIKDEHDYYEIVNYYRSSLSCKLIAASRFLFPL